MLCILGNVGIQQVKRNVARDGLPYANRYEPFGELDTYAQFGAVFLGEQRYWQLFEVGIRIGGLLIAFAVDGLEKIALAIEQSNAHQRDAHIARSLAVVAGENTQSAGVDGKALVKAELGAKVCDEIVARENVRAVRADLLRVVRVVCRQRPVQVGAKNRIVACLAQSLLIDLPQECLGILPRGFPEGRMQPLEKLPGGPVPAVPEIAREFLEPLEPVGKSGIDFDSVRCAWRLHAVPCARSNGRELF